MAEAGKETPIERRRAQARAAQARWREKNSISIAARNAAYYAANQDREKERARAFRVANPEQVKASTASWRENNAERHAAMKVTYRTNNRDHVAAYRKAQYEKSRAVENAGARAWKKSNPHMVNAATARRAAAKMGATPAWADHKKIEGFYVTAQGLGMHTGDWHHVDHIVPLQSKLVCGLHCEANLQVLSGAENQSKGNRYWPDMPIF